MVSYKCIYCQQKFIYKGNYRSHNKNVNKCKKRLEEDIIKYKGYTEEKLHDDFINLTLIDESRYKCKFCDKNYNSYNGLKRHLKMACSKNNIIITNETNSTNETITTNKTNNTNETNNTNNTNVKQIDKYKKKQIPLSLKRVVWDFWIGEDIGRTKCLCCNVAQISQMNFHCGHIIAEINGGSLEPQNLKPICQSCNSSMRTTNMDVFIQTYGLNQNVTDRINKN